MTNRIALALALVVLALLAVDYLAFGWEFTLFLSRKFSQLVEYVAFWR